MELLQSLNIFASPKKPVFSEREQLLQNFHKYNNEIKIMRELQFFAEPEQAEALDNGIIMYERLRAITYKNICEMDGKQINLVQIRYTPEKVIITKNGVTTEQLIE